MPPPLIEGATDKERWSKFQAIQPNLIGDEIHAKSKRRWVMAKLFFPSQYEPHQAIAAGKGKSSCPEKPETPETLSYNITENNGPHKVGDVAAIEVIFDLSHGVVESYKVQAVYWGN